MSTDAEQSLESLQNDIDSGKYNDILNKYCFLTFTEKGLVLVKQDKSITINSTVDLSNYVKISESPSFAFEEDGTLLVTINGVTHKYAPITT
jgi:hypothetical protein